MRPLSPEDGESDAVVVVQARPFGRRRLAFGLACGSVVLIGVGVFPRASQRRRLALVGGYELDTSWSTAQNLVTADGAVPSMTCPAGKYRPTASFDSNFRRRVGLRVEGCRDCPPGRYGETPGLTEDYCTQDCPVGRYRDTPGAASAEDCAPCPPGVYGDETGLTTALCSGKCPAGKYSDVWALDDRLDCKACPEGYRGWQCSWEVVAQHLSGDRDHHYDLDTIPSRGTKPAKMLRRSPINFRKGTNLPRPDELTNPYKIPLVNESGTVYFKPVRRR